MKKILLMLSLGLVLLISNGCESLSSANNAYKEVKLGFSHNNNHLSGSLILPKKAMEPFPVVIFVHGDGATPYDSYGYYKHLWKHLAESGIASYSWSKAGVGASTGNWLTQSMDDRADEVIAAINNLKRRNDIATGKIGLIGYSQAGWVLPLVAKKSAYPDFMMVVGGAINWMDQGNYLGENRLRRKGFSDAQIAQAQLCNKDERQILQPTATYADYLNYRETLSAECKPFAAGQMAAERYEFVKLNWRSDAREGLAAVQCPTLGVFGDQDSNVDIAETIREYQRIFAKSGNNALTIKVYPAAQHALFKIMHIDEISPGIRTVMKMEQLGEAIFADGYLDFVTKWVKETTSQL